jgi:hypothetical protein
MCGHIHTPADKMLGDIHYLNSGDWIESLTAIVEHWDGTYQLIEYSDFVKQFPFPDEDAAPEEQAPGAVPEAAPRFQDEHSESPVI